LHAHPRGLAPSFIRVLALAGAAAPLIAAMFLPADRAWGALPGYAYLSPEPGSERVSPWNNIAIRSSDDADAQARLHWAPAVVGSISGLHTGAWELSDDQRTLIFTPDQPYALGETVSVKLAGGATSPPLSFDFQVSSADPRQARPRPLEDWMPAPGAAVGAQAPGATLPAAVQQLAAPQACDTMPISYLPATVMYSDHPDPGCIFMSPSVLGIGNVGHLMIVDNFGVPLFAQATGASVLDFKMQPNGRLSYFMNNGFTVLDSTYSVVDFWSTGNGYFPDPHDFVLLPNGHGLLMAYDTQTVDMSRIVPGGNPAAQVTGLIVQELDAAKHVAFQWRSWDHYKITDMIEVPGRSLTGASIDWVHGNAVEPTADGNLLISARHMDEITKVNRQTGATIWRMGLNSKNNDFTFVNDARGFSHQHDIRELPNGDLTVFDNGNFLNPQYSRGVEYAVDEVNKIATMVWEYRHTPDIFGQATGSNRRSPNGSKLISWGLNTPDPKFTDLHPDDSIALEMGFGAISIFSYRTFRFPWHTTQFVASDSALDFGPFLIGQTLPHPLTVHNNTSLPITLTCFASSNPAFTIAQPVPLEIPPLGDAVLSATFTPGALGTTSGRLYLRSVQGSTLVAQPVDVTGSGVGTEGVGGTPASGLWLSAQPNPARGERIIAFGLPQAAHATLEIFDLSGRRVATPFRGTASPGLNQVRWGARVGSAPPSGGVYFAVLTTRFGTRTLKLVHLDR
jgi:hypothetical protein